MGLSWFCSGKIPGNWCKNCPVAFWLCGCQREHRGWQTWGKPVSECRATAVWLKVLAELYPALFMWVNFNSNQTILIGPQHPNLAYRDRPAHIGTSSTWNYWGYLPSATLPFLTDHRRLDTCQNSHSTAKSQQTIKKHFSKGNLSFAIPSIWLQLKVSIILSGQSSIKYFECNSSHLSNEVIPHF